MEVKEVRILFKVAVLGYCSETTHISKRVTLLWLSNRYRV
jgi:hypothetical protein